MSLFSQQRSTRRTVEQPVAQDAPPAGAGASTLFKRYRPLETRASGGFGSVEICLDTRLQRRVAIKRMPLASGPDGAPHETTSTALAEARTASMLQHPNIVQVIDFTYDSAYAYLVMEYVDGVTLEEFLAGVPGHSLTFDEAACIADALVQALSYAHENGVLHLDIKPANVLIDRSGHVKLTDFGMAALASSAGFGGARGGTIGYMPPEQLRGEEVDERTDVFALACVLYEALCAEAPFRATTPQDSLRRIERGVTPPRELLPDLPENSEEALLRALSPDAHDRMRSVDALGDRFLAHLGSVREGRRSLERIIASLTSDEDGDDGTDPGAEPLPKHARREQDRTWTLDPAEGYLGSRFPRARDVVVGAACGISTGWLLWWMLGFLAVEGAAVRAVIALATGLAAALAPQLGSALVLAGLLALAVDGATSVSALPVIIVAVAIEAAWWLVWGRTSSAASMVLTMTLALAAATDGAATAAWLAAAAAAYLLTPSTGAATVASGIAAACFLLELADGGTPGLAAAALADPTLWIGVAALAAETVLVSLALQHAWRRYLDDGGKGFAAFACAIPLVTCLAVIALDVIMTATGMLAASRMEIADVLGAGFVSSIMAFVCVFAFGIRKDQGEDDGR